MDATVRLKALIDHPCRKKWRRIGDIYFATPRDAKFVVRAGWAEEKPAKIAAKAPAPAPTEPPKTPAPNKGQYKRRDMTAEG